MKAKDWNDILREQGLGAFVAAGDSPETDADIGEAASAASDAAGGIEIKQQVVGNGATGPKPSAATSADFDDPIPDDIGPDATGGTDTGEPSGSNGADDTANDTAPTVVLSLDDFFSYALGGYIFAPSRDIWPATSVNARLEAPAKEKISASKWLDQNRSVEQMTWARGEPLLIKDRLIAHGGWIKRPGATIFNLYLPPNITPREGNVTPWLNLIRKVFPQEADHIVLWLAHRRQRPNEKINHALVLGGKPGVGKDTMLEPVKQAIGPWNFPEASPKQVLGRFNGFLQVAVILRVNEARDLGEFDRYALYDHMKAVHRRAARRAARRRKEPARIRHSQPLRRHHHHQPQDGRHSTCRPTIAATS